MLAPRRLSSGHLNDCASNTPYISRARELFYRISVRFGSVNLSNEEKTANLIMLLIDEEAISYIMHRPENTKVKFKYHDFI